MRERVSECDDEVGGERSRAVVGEQGVEQRAQHTPLWCAGDDDKRGGDGAQLKRKSTVQDGMLRLR